MTRASERGAATRAILIVIVALVVFAAGLGLWLVLGPGPMDFAGGKRDALTSAPAGAGPTGVPAELANASLLERGQYLTRAADCIACHTTEDGQPFEGPTACEGLTVFGRVTG
ncbi:MAG TPA: hypothetical protein VNH41_11175, partial [Steroidobacteraceae bacterium]|nr:hypothetical protein [Steroidobacteraceae bacterium]